MCFGDAPSVLVAARDNELWAIAIGARAVGGLILKRINAEGDRSVLVTEQLPHNKQGFGEWDPGSREAHWDEHERALRIPMRLEQAGTC